MAGIFTDGIAEIRPGTYFNVNTDDGSSVVGAKDGITGVVFQGDFGPLNEVVKLTAEEGYYDTFGDGGNVDAIEYAFLGGAKEVLAVRVGAEGTPATVKLGEIATITAKYPGSREFSVSVKDSLTDDGKKEITFYSSNRRIESYTITKSTDKEGAALAEAMKPSKRFSAAVNTDGQLANATQLKFTAGTNPTAEVENYSEGFEKLESQYMNALCVDTEDGEVHLLLKAFLDRAYNNGFFACGFVAEAATEELEDRIENAAAFNDEKMVYVLNSRVSLSGTEVEGYQTAAILAGMYASYPSNKALTHKLLPQVSELLEVLTPSQMEDAEQKGCLVLSRNPEGKVWVDNAINTLVSLPENKDAGWQKIRRTRTRFELMYRMNTTADKLVGNVDNDKNGRETVIANLNDVAAAMVQEQKLMSCSVSEHPNKTSDADYAHFMVDVVDKDSLEHLYLYYTFRYSTNDGEEG